MNGSSALSAAPVPVHTADKFTFYRRAAYLVALRAKVEQAGAGSRVLVAAMTFDNDEPEITRLFGALQQAAGRSVQVTLLVDAYDFLIRDNKHIGPLWAHKSMPPTVNKHFQQKWDVLQRLRAAGIRVGITNQPDKRFTSPFAGRSHIKAAIVDDFIFVGGCNLDDVTQIDLMAGWHDQHTADWLYRKLYDVAEYENVRTTLGHADLVHRVDDHTTMLLDVGVKEQSLILDQAIEVIDAAQEWLVITCQYVQHNVTAAALQRAEKRGVRVLSIYNDYSQHSIVYNLLYRSVAVRQKIRTRREKPQYHKRLPGHLPYMHAKLIATEHEAMLGSHNYVIAGVNFGTAEIALRFEGAEVSHAALQSLVDQFAAHGHDILKQLL